MTGPCPIPVRQILCSVKQESPKRLITREFRIPWDLTEPLTGQCDIVITPEGLVVASEPEGEYFWKAYGVRPKWRRPGRVPALSTGYILVHTPRLPDEWAYWLRSFRPAVLRPTPMQLTVEPPPQTLKEFTRWMTP